MEKRKEARKGEETMGQEWGAGVAGEERRSEETGKRRGDEAWPAEQRVMTALAHGASVGGRWGGSVCECECAQPEHREMRQ